MAKESARSQQLGNQIQRELSLLIQNYIKDAGLGLVTVSAVQLSPDKRHAKIFITYLANDFSSLQDKKKVLDILNGMIAKFRHHLSKKLSTRGVPTLQLMFDEHLDRAERLSSLIHGLNSKPTAN